MINVQDQTRDDPSADPALDDFPNGQGAVVKSGPVVRREPQGGEPPSAQLARHGSPLTSELQKEAMAFNARESESRPEPTAQP